jgi:tetratricopeptide (TPR) repeat protein
VRITAAVLFALVLLQSDPAEIAHQKAIDDLAAGNAEAAVAAARQAIESSLLFDPQAEIGSRPAKGLLFDDMILEARRVYRKRRARYFRTLGDALALGEHWRASRKAYVRAAKLTNDPELWSLMSDDPDLKPSERLELMIRAYLAAAGPDRAGLEKSLLETGAFRSRHALQASLDQHRFGTLRAEFGDLQLVPGAFPRFQAATNRGNLVTADLFREGRVLIAYFPIDACGRCSEELDGLTVPVLESRKEGINIDVAAFVPEVDLPIARRIVRLLGMDVGVARTEGLPPSLSYSKNGEIRVIARGGLTQIRMEMSPELTGHEIRRRMEAIFRFLNAPGLPTNVEPEDGSVPLVTLERGANDQRTLFEWIDELEWLEAVPAPLDDFYRSLDSLTQHVLRGAENREVGVEVLERLSRLRGANGAKLTALGTLGNRIGERLLERAQSLDPDVRRSTSAERGTLFVGIGRGDDPEATTRVYLQRAFQTNVGLTHFAFALRDVTTDIEIAWAGPEPNEPLGVEAVGSGGAFHYRVDDECPRGLRFVSDGEVAYESCEAIVLDQEIVEVGRAIVDEVPDPPLYYRYDVVRGAEPTSLELGLRHFNEGQFGEAASDFERARSEVDSVAPYDESDVVYNLARSLEEQGKRQEALSLYRGLGDLPYQETVDERASLIESGR